MNEKKEIYLQCECGSEVLHVWYDPEVRSYDLCIYRIASHPAKLSWKQRFQFCWNIIIKGNCYSDQMMLSKQSGKELTKFLEDTSDEDKS